MTRPHGGRTEEIGRDVQPRPLRQCLRLRVFKDPLAASNGYAASRKPDRLVVPLTADKASTSADELSSPPNPQGGFKASAKPRTLFLWRPSNIMSGIMRYGLAVTSAKRSLAPQAHSKGLAPRIIYIILNGRRHLRDWLRQTLQRR
jgi:hypothetical protein